MRQFAIAAIIGILMVVAYNMAEFNHFRHLLRAPRSDTLVLFACFLLTVFTDMVIAVVVGMLLAAVLSDTVLLRSPTTTERDRSAVDYLQRALGIDATEFGRRMFEESSDTSGISADQLVTRDVKEYQAAGGYKLFARAKQVS